MAGNEHRDWVRAARLTHRARRSFRGSRTSDLPVTSGRAGRDSAQGPPNRSLKNGAGREVQRRERGWPAPGENLLQRSLGGAMPPPNAPGKGSMGSAECAAGAGEFKPGQASLGIGSYEDAVGGGDWQLSHVARRRFTRLSQGFDLTSCAGCRRAAAPDDRARCGAWNGRATGTPDESRSGSTFAHGSRINPGFRRDRAWEVG